MTSDYVEDEANAKLIQACEQIDAELAAETHTPDYNQRRYDGVVEWLEVEHQNDDINTDAWRRAMRTWNEVHEKMEGVKTRAMPSVVAPVLPAYAPSLGVGVSTGVSTSPRIPPTASAGIGMTDVEKANAALLDTTLSDYAVRYYQYLLNIDFDSATSVLLRLAEKNRPAATRLLTEMTGRFAILQRQVGVDSQRLCNSGTLIRMRVGEVQVARGSETLGPAARGGGLGSTSGPRQGLSVQGLAGKRMSERDVDGKRKGEVDWARTPKKMKLSERKLEEGNWRGWLHECAEVDCEKMFADEGEFQAHVRTKHGRFGFQVDGRSESEETWYGRYVDMSQRREADAKVDLSGRMVMDPALEKKGKGKVKVSELGKASVEEEI